MSPNGVRVLLADTIAPVVEERVRATVPAGLDLVRLPADRRVPEAARDAEVLFTAGLPREALAALIRELPSLRWIHGASAGVDRLLVPEARERDLVLTRTGDARAGPIAEHVLALTLALLRRLPEMLDAQRTRRWERRPLATVAGATVGIVGTGAIGRAAAARFAAFEARVIGIKRTPEPLGAFDAVWGRERLLELASLADVLVLACPLTDETRHLVDRELLAAMRPSAVLVNVSRGAVVAEADLVEALRAGTIAGAALDVFEREPLPEEHPLWALPNAIVSPHTASSGPGVREAVADEFVANLVRWLQGVELAHRVGSWERGY